MQKNLSLIIKANQEFIRHTGEDKITNAPILNVFYESISSTYIPMLEMLGRLEADNISFCVGLVLPPVLCNLLSDEDLQESYIAWLDKKNELGLKELNRNASNPEIKELVQAYIDENLKTKTLFEEKYNKKLIPAFAQYMEKGYIELLGTCGTDIFMPHFADLKEVISAQIECGLHSFRQFFGIVPEGFWLPELGYTTGVEKLIKAYGYTYTILDPRSTLLAEKVPSSGIFYPCRTDNSLVLFSNSKAISEELLGEEGYIYKAPYKNQNRDIGYELEMSDLTPLLSEGGSRYSTGFKYWNRDFDNDDGQIYNPELACNQAEEDAVMFLKNRSQTLSQAAIFLKDKAFVTEVCALDVDKYFKTWNEGFIWLEAVIRHAKEYDLNLSTCASMCEDQFNLEKINPYYSAACGEGYGENLLSSKNCWMMRYIRKACERMVDLADRFPNDTGLKTRLLNLGAKELMLAQSSRLPKTIDVAENPIFAERRFKESIAAFTAVFDSLGSNTVSTEWLTTLEARDSIFPWMNYRIFSKKR
ncbi:MAG: DUF1957 domain-containing protein [Treponema sp.]|nr:DUF1957 domain-containing protein [Treponema sp.]